MEDEGGRTNTERSPKTKDRVAAHLKKIKFKDISRNFSRFQGHFYENFEFIIISAMLENTLKITKY